MDLDHKTTSAQLAHDIQDGGVPAVLGRPQMSPTEKRIVVDVGETTAETASAEKRRFRKRRKLAPPPSPTLSESLTEPLRPLLLCLGFSCADFAQACRVTLGAPALPRPGKSAVGHFGEPWPSWGGKPVLLLPPQCEMSF